MSRRLQLPVHATPADAATRRRGDAAIPGDAAAGRSSGCDERRDPPAQAGAETPRPRVAASAATGDTLWRALHDVMDPEFPISIVDLGLVYGVRREGDVVEVDLTFTATACPCMDFIEEDVRERLLQEAGVRDVLIRHVWSPPWTRDRISAEGRAILRRHGVAA